MEGKNIILGIVIILGIALICGLGAVMAALFTKQSTPSNLPPTLDINTAVAEAAEAFTVTSIFSLDTSTPTATFTPRPTRTPLPTWTQTNTPRPLPTRTPIPSITPTFSASNPAAGLGDPTWRDEFDTDIYWTFFDDNCFKTQIINEKYVQTTKRVPAGVCWEITWAKIQDFYLETVATVTSGCAERDRYGIYFRGSSDQQSGYLFGITCKQEFWLSYWDGNTYQRNPIVDYTVSDKIKMGEPNKLGVLATADRIVLYINDALVAEVYDSTFTGKGPIGFFIGSEITPAFTVEYDYLAYWENP
jgi:hypothetical protein